jgi:hypothetical protein
MHCLRTSNQTETTKSLKREVHNSHNLLRLILVKDTALSSRFRHPAQSHKIPSTQINFQSLVEHHPLLEIHIYQIKCSKEENSFSQCTGSNSFQVPNKMPQDTDQGQRPQLNTSHLLEMYYYYIYYHLFPK